MLEQLSLAIDSDRVRLWALNTSEVRTPRVDAVPQDNKIRLDEDHTNMWKYALLQPTGRVPSICLDELEHVWETGLRERLY